MEKATHNDPDTSAVLTGIGALDDTGKSLNTEIMQYVLVQ